MPRPLTEAIRQCPLFLEPVPPTARSSPERAARQVDEVVRSIRAEPRIDAIDIPELVDENHDGRPYYRSGDPRVFARALTDETQRAVIVNKVVAHLPSAAALEVWVQDSILRGLPHFVLVGGSSRYIPYPGPAVVEADRISRPFIERAGGLLGNIAIPQRAGEAHRLLAKTRAGAQFFTTQILFDFESVVRMLREYDLLCRQAGLAPSTVLLSVAPLSDEGDLEFVRWLGAEVPEATERTILNGDDSDATDRSVKNALHVWAEVERAARRYGLDVPLGVNVEQISLRHLPAAGTMVREFARVLPSAGPPETSLRASGTAAS